MAKTSYKKNNIQKLDENSFYQVSGGMNDSNDIVGINRMGAESFINHHFNYNEIVRLDFGAESYSDDYDDLTRRLYKRDNPFIRPKTFVNSKKSKK